jgi:hypothetical protein
MSRPTASTDSKTRGAWGRRIGKGVAAVVATAVTTPMALVAPGAVEPASALPTPIQSYRPLARTLNVNFRTGADGINAGSRMNLLVSVPDRSDKLRVSLNNGAAVAGNTSLPSRQLDLQRLFLRTEIQRIELEWQPSGVDTVDVASVVVDSYVTDSALVNVDWARIVNRSGTPFARYGASTTASIPMAITSAARPATVNLTNMQTLTPLRRQGGRGTCTIFTAVGALEAAYRRAGYGALNLSEEFANYTGKMMFIDPNPTASAAAAENQLGTSSGGHTWSSVENLAKISIPLETDMPYRSTLYTEAEHPQLDKIWDDPKYTVQRTVNDVNLANEGGLAPLMPESAKNASTYYGSTGSVRLSGVSLGEIQSVLASNHEVALGLAATAGGPHAILLYGYAPSSVAGDPTFLVKDSAPWINSGSRWSMIQAARPDSATYITGVRVPGPRYDYGFLGRWNLDFDGWRGTLDISRIPSTGSYRIGTFFDQAGTAFRVNGSIDGPAGLITFFVDGTNPNMLPSSWPTLTARRFTYRLMRVNGQATLMSGTHTDPNGGGTYGGFARKGTPIEGSAPLAMPITINSYLGSSFSTTWNGVTGNIYLGHSYGQDALTNTVPGTFYFTNGGSAPVTMVIDRANPGKVTLTANGWSTQTALKLNHEPGIFAGQNLLLVKR